MRIICSWIIPRTPPIESNLCPTINITYCKNMMNFIRIIYVSNRGLFLWCLLLGFVGYLPFVLVKFAKFILKYNECFPCSENKWRYIFINYTCSGNKQYHDSTLGNHKNSNRQTLHTTIKHHIKTSKSSPVEIHI